MQQLFENWRKYVNEVAPRKLTQQFVGGGQDKGQGVVAYNNLMGLYNDYTGEVNFKINGPYDFDIQADGRGRVGYIITPTKSGIEQAKYYGLKIPETPTAIYYSSGTGGVSRPGELVSFGGASTYPIGDGRMGHWYIKAPYADKAQNPFAFDNNLLMTLNGGYSPVGPVPVPRRTISGTTAVNKFLQKFGAFKSHWVNYLRTPKFKFAYTGMESPSELAAKQRYWHGREIPLPVKKQPQAVINKQLRDPRVQRELKTVEKIIPKKQGAWAKFARKIPGLKYLFVVPIAAAVVAQADAAYASSGLPGALKVYAEAGVDLTPIIGDVKGFADLMRLFVKSPDYKKMQRFVDAYKLAGKGATGIKSDPESVARDQRQKRIEQGIQKAQAYAQRDMSIPPVKTLPKEKDTDPALRPLSDEEKARLGKFVQNLRPGR